MKNKSILFAVAMILLLTISVVNADNVVKAVVIEWVEKGVGGKTHTETIYCAADCDKVVAKRVAEITQAGGVIIDDGSGNN